jgi:HSP20 family molecular chaperone IbpA
MLKTRRRKVIAALIVPLVALVAVILIFRTPGNVAETSPASADRQLLSRSYKVQGGVETAKKTIEDLIPTLSTYGRNWRVVSHDNNPKANIAIKDDEIKVRAEVPVVVFTDDLQVRLRKGAIEGEVAVDVKSASRVGKSDFGENRRHIIQLLTALDEKVGASSSK